MATKSFLKNVSISNKNMGTSFVNALRDCETAKSIDVTLTSKPKELTGAETIKRVLDGLKR